MARTACERASPRCSETCPTRSGASTRGSSKGDALFLEWSAESATSRADDGGETFLVRDREIVLQTVHYTVQRP
jgi:hypothetical protein